MNNSLGRKVFLTAGFYLAVGGLAFASAMAVDVSGRTLIVIQDYGVVRKIVREAARELNVAACGLLALR